MNWKDVAGHRHQHGVNILLIRVNTSHPHQSWQRSLAPGMEEVTSGPIPGHGNHAAPMRPASNLAEQHKDLVETSTAMTSLEGLNPRGPNSTELQPSAPPLDSSDGRVGSRGSS